MAFVLAVHLAASMVEDLVGLLEQCLVARSVGKMGKMLVENSADQSVEHLVMRKVDQMAALRVAMTVGWMVVPLAEQKAAPMAAH